MARWITILTVSIFLPSCVQFCSADSDCNDGVWCNGEEFCDVRPVVNNIIANILFQGRLQRGQCNIGDPPCCSDDLDCEDFTIRFAATEVCNETQMLCEMGNECQLDHECDDGIWCNGDEFCASGFCFSHSDQCGVLETCNEEEKRCNENNKGACFRVLDFCPNRDRTGELASIALVLGTTDIPDDVMISSDGVCKVPEIEECNWPSYADCVTTNITCASLRAGRPENSLSACLDIFKGVDCFVHLNRTAGP